MLNLADLLPSRGAATSGDPRDNFWFQNLGNMRRTASGETVTPQRALTLSAYFACIRVISEDVAKLPLHVYESLDPRGKRSLPDHAVSKLLCDSPNPEMTAYTFRETVTQWALGWGRGYAEIVRDGTGKPIELWPIHPSRAKLMRVNGRLILRVISDSDPVNAQGNGIRKAVDLDMRDVLHIRGLGSDLDGYSIAAYAAESIGAALAAESYGAAFFANGASMSGVLTHPGTLGEVARKNLRDSWKKVYGGAKGERLAILEEGLKFETISIPPDEAQFLETRQFSVEEICRWFRVSPHKIQHLLRSTFSNIEQQSIEHVTDTLMPWLMRWESEVKRSMIRDESRVYLKHNVNGLLRGDANARANYVRTMVNIGAMSPNEVREYEDENPIPGDAGDDYYMQSNMSTLERIASGQVTTGTSAKANESTEPAPEAYAFSAFIETLRPCVVAAADQVLRKEAMAVGRHAGKAGVTAWAETFFREQSAYLVEAMEPTVQALARAGSELLGVPLAVVDLPGFADAYCEAGRKSVAAGAALDASRVPAALAETVIGLVIDAYAYPAGKKSHAAP